MVHRPYWPLVLVAVGVVLLLNPLYLYPGGVPAEQTYTLRAEQVDDLGGVLRSGETGAKILHCSAGAGPHENRNCVFESLVGPNGTLVIQNRSLSDGTADGDALRYPFDYVTFDGKTEFYEPRTRTENGSVVLSLDPVSAWAVAENSSIVPYRAAPDAVQRAIDTGAENATVRLPDGGPPGTDRADALSEYVGSVGNLVERDGTYYRVSSGVSYDRHAVAPLAVTTVRAVAVVAGLALIYRAVLRQRDPGDSA